MVRPLRPCLAAFVCAWAAIIASGGAAGSNDFRFAVVGDRTGEAVPGVYEHVWRQIEAERPDFVVTVGDTIEGGDDAGAAAEWRQVRPVWKRSGLPVFFAPGNHDVWSDASARIYAQETGRPLSYSFDWGNAHFTVLDNSRTEELSPDQIAFLDRDLARNSTRNPKFIIFHRSFWLIYLKLRNPNFELHRLARKYRVTAVLSGHLHQYDRLDQDGVTYLSVCSSGGHLRTSDGAEDTAHGWFFGHVLATVRDGQVSFAVKPLHGGGS